MTITRTPCASSSGTHLAGSDPHPNLADAKGVVNSINAVLVRPQVLQSAPAHRGQLHPLTDEKLFGGGESFTRLNKAARRWSSTYDAYSVQTPNMYKPVPFFMSSRGYGMFVHIERLPTLDLGGSYGEAAVIYLGDDELDLFFFFGSPKEDLSEYTALTGRAPDPSSGRSACGWAGRLIHPRTERDVAKKLREHRIPPTSSTSTPVGRRCPTAATSSSPHRVPRPETHALRPERRRLPHKPVAAPLLQPEQRAATEAIEKGYVVLSASGKPPVDDAVLDLSNPDAVRWYQGISWPIF